MKKLILILAICLFPIPALAVDNESGRYQIFMTQIMEKKDELTQLPVLLDTKTGRTWYMGSDLAWYPMFAYKEKPKHYHDEGVKFGGSYEPQK